MSRYLLFGFVLLFCCSLTAAQGQPVQLTFGEQRDVDPAVSPDENLLVFSSNRADDFKLYVMEVGDTSVRAVTSGPKNDRFPAWDPTGTRVIFSSNRAGDWNLHACAVDGGAGVLQLTTTEKMDEDFPSYEPGGSGVLFVKGNKGFFKRRTKGTVVFAPSPDEVGRARTLISDGLQPRFSPDGKQIVFVSDRYKNLDVLIAGADGSRQIQLTKHEAADKEPCFSPDGEQIVFTSKRTGNFDLYVMNADGTGVQQITFDEADEVQPFWASNGTIYYTREFGPTRSNLYAVVAPK